MDEEKKRTIFIVEDDLDLSEMLRAYFRVQGYDVDFAVQGEAAVDAIRDRIPDVVLLDIRLPDINGYEVCRRLRQTRRTQNIPVIFLTERREREDKLAGLELGAVDYITKPFDIQELRLRVRNALRRSRLSTVQNPVTGLAEGSVVHERLESALRQPDWGIVMAGLRNLSKFRDRYGFVSADDVSRAVTLMISNAVEESGSGGEFIGHTDKGDFIILTTSQHSLKIAERCMVRLRPSIQYFYPAIERQRLHQMPEVERLAVRVSHLDSKKHIFSDLEALFSELDENAL